MSKTSRTDQKRWSAKRILQFAVFLGIVIFVLDFALMEIYTRATGTTIDLDSLTGRTKMDAPMAQWAYLDAFCAYRAKPGQYDDGKTVDSYGFISTPEIEPTKPSGVVRIVFLGGSSTAGTGRNLKDEETWPWQAVEKLRADGLHVDFINGALGGYTSFESYGRLWSRIRHFSPDIVVVYHGWNELYYFDEVDDIASWRTLPDGSWSFKTEHVVQMYKPWRIDPFIKWSQWLTRLRLRFSTRVVGEAGQGVKESKSKELANDFDPRGLEIWRTNLELLAGACRIMGAQLLVAKQATLFVANLSLEQQKRCQFEFHGMDLGAHVLAFQGIYRVIDEETPAADIVDVTALSGVPENFYDHIHPTPLGASRIADVMYGRLAPIVREMEEGAGQ